jgi:hypothetical protein
MPKGGDARSPRKHLAAPSEEEFAAPSKRAKPSSPTKASVTSPRSPMSPKVAARGIKLHSYWRSSCSWRVRIALALKNINYDYAPVNLLKGEQVETAYTSKNPNGRVPSLEIDGHFLSQSGAIIEYLEETRPNPPLLPKDSALRAQVRNLCCIIGCDIQPIQNLAVMVRFTSGGGSRYAFFGQFFCTLSIWISKLNAASNFFS